MACEAMAQENRLDLSLARNALRNRGAWRSSISLLPFIPIVAEPRKPKKRTTMCCICYEL